MPEPDLPRPYSAEDLRARFSARVAAEEAEGRSPREWGDHRLNAALVSRLDATPGRAAAVLIPVVDRGDEASVILTTRTASLRAHSGQIAFPGGTADPGDPSPEATALREAHEEIGLSPAFVEPLGLLPRYATLTGYRITPVLALVRPGFALSPNPAEVEDVFEVPLAFLMTAANHRAGKRMVDDLELHFFAMPFGERHIWGITAGIIRMLYERLYE